MIGFLSIYYRIMAIGAVRRQAIITFFWKMAFTFIGFLSTMYFAHEVGASVLGAYFLFLSYNALFSQVTNGGLGGAAIKRISEGEAPSSYFSAYFTMRLILTVTILITLTFFRSHFVDLDNSGMFVWLLLSLLVSIISGPISSGVAGMGKMGVRSTCAALGNISGIIIQVILVYIGYETVGLAGGLVVGILIAAVIEFRFFDLQLTSFTWEHVKSLYSFSFWLFLTSGGTLIFSQADTVMIGYFMDNSDVGIYRIAFQFTTVATFVTYAIRDTLWPKVSRWGKKGDIGLIEKSLSNAISYSSALAIPVLIGGFLLGEKLLYFFYGAEFSQGYYALIILLFMQVVSMFQYFFTMYLDALNKPKESFKITVIGVGANIMLNFVLIPFIGINGAALATLLTMALNALLAGKLLSKIIPIQLDFTNLLGTLEASFVMGFLLIIYILLFPLLNIWTTLMAVFIGGCIYIVLLFKLNKQISNELYNIMSDLGFVWREWRR